MRLCKVCESNITEDEVHFLMLCPAYQELRQLYYDIRRELGLETYDFISILNCDKTCFYVAKLLQKMFKTRSSMLSKDTE